MFKDNRIKKAVFPVAGFGTRFLPVTKAMPKELLPIINKPLIQYAVEEAIEAGIDTLIFITGRNKRAIEDHFDSNPELEMELRSKGKVEEANQIANLLPEGVECIFIRQHRQLGLGHAVLCAERVVGKEAFAVLLADDFMEPNKHNPTKQLLESYLSSRKSQLSIMKVDSENSNQYGMIRFDANGAVIGIVEKPNPSETPSEFASIGRYILTPSIFTCLKETPRGKNGEIQLADALNTLASIGEVEVNKLKANRYDCGSVAGFVDATLRMSKK